MPAILVPEIQVVMFRYVRQIRNMYFKLAMVFISPFLTSICLECADIDSKRDTSFAAVAVGAVSKHAATPETLCNQFRISIIVYEVTGCRNLRSGFPMV